MGVADSAPRAASLTGQRRKGPATRTAQAEPGAVRVRRRRLPNGLTVVVSELPHLHRAAVELLGRIGSRYETPARNGLSHFLEHMLFRGTRTYPSHFALADAIERLGATLQATTYPDYTTFDVSVPPAAVADVLAIFADVVQHPLFLDLEVEKGIVREEILEDLDEDGRDVDSDNLVRNLLFGSHPLGFRVTGTSRNVERFDTVDLDAHRRRHYVGRNLVLSVAGAVSAEEVFRAAELRFGALEPGKRPRVRPPAEARGAPRCEVHDSQGNQSDVRISFPTFAERDPRMPALRLLSRVLDDGLSTRLYRRICDELGLCYEVFAGLDPYEDTGVFDLGGTVANERAAELVRELLEVAASLRESVTDEELEKAKQRLRWELIATRDDPEGVAHFYGLATLFASATTLEREVDAVGRATREDVLEVARQVIRREGMAVVVVGALPDRGSGVRAVVEAFR